jgi:hypothetical protein
MKYTVYKLIANYEKEEKWLNEMANKGMNLIDYSFGRYLFDEGKPGEYIYRMELLKNPARHPESIAYIRFMEELGIECVATYYKWAYFRKKSAEGSFELFSDYDSKIAHYSSTVMFVNVAFGLNAITALMNFVIPIFFWRSGLSQVNIICGFINLSITLLLVPIYMNSRRKLKRLREERALRE